MKRILICAVAAVILTSWLAARLLAEPSSSNLIGNLPGRTSISLDGVWRVIVDPYETGVGGRYYENRKPKDQNDLVEYDFDHAWTLNVPGDWNTQRESLFFYEGPVWYKKSFSYAKKAHTRTFLYFGAANYFARVYLNGKKIGEHEGGYTPFNFEITDEIADGDNFVIVEVNNARRADAVPPPNTDWWNYGGLTRGVALAEEPETFIKNYSVHLAKGSMNEVAGWVQLDGAKEPQEVTIEIPEAGIKQRATTDSTGRAAFHFSAKLNLWTPDDPKLYRVAISAAGDAVAEEIGFRSIETRGTQILLNGKPIFLRGINMHDEAPFRGGRAFSEEDARTLLSWAKELGCNFLRLAHYPHNENTVRLADRMGLLLWAEVPNYWGIAWDNPATLENAETQMRDLIARDQNRAAVILLSLSNETRPTPARTEYLKNLAAYTRQLDDARLLTSALNVTEREGPDTRLLADPLGEYLDVLGLNEYVGWYEGKTEDTDRLQWKFAYAKPLIISEFGAEAPAGNHGDPGAKWTEEYQANLYEHQINMFRKIPSLAGTTPWLLMDFLSARRPLVGIQDFHNRKGLVSERGLHKQAFYVLQKYYKEMAEAGR